MARTCVTAAAVAVVSLMLASCATPDVPKDSESVANVFVSAYPAVRWNSISDKLEPKFDLSTADARAMAAVSTQSQVSQVLSTLSAGLAIGLPSATHDRTTTLSADGSSASTGTRKILPGTIPSTTGSSPIAITDATLAPDLSKAAPGLGVDGYTQLMGATSLLQLSKILENQNSQAIVPEGFRAYLVTFQVNLQPLRRNLPYDAYVNLTLMPASWQKALATSIDVSQKADALSPIMVYPLIVTDAMETGSVAKSVEAIKQASLALSGIVNNIGIGGSLQKGSDAFEAMLGSDRNSLVTVGRISDHSLRIRVGAQLQGTTKFALVPRSYNVSVVIFAAADLGDPAKLIDRLSVITKTSFVSLDGVEMPSSRNTDVGVLALKEKLDEALLTYGYRVNEACRRGQETSLDLLRAMDRGDYAYLNKCLYANPESTIERDAFQGWTRLAMSNAVNPCESRAKTLSVGRILQPSDVDPSITCLEPIEEARLRRVIAELMTLQTNSRYSKLMIQLDSLESIAPRSPKSSQLALLSDTKAAAKVVLRDAGNLEGKKMSASLLFSMGGTLGELPASAIDVSSDGTSVALTFPSLSANGLTPKIGTAEAAPTSLKIVLTHFKENSRKSSFWSESYIAKLVPPVDEKVDNPLTTSTTVLIVAEDGTAQVTLLSPVWDQPNAALGIRITGADLRAIEPAGAYQAARSAFAIPAATVVKLTLGNVSPSRPVVIRTLAGTKEIGTPISLPVEVGRSAER